ncbi:NAD(P)-dependent oxidoreductase [Streptomyces bacillaris]|uniref:NAD(P)-dependent oxidoreductase n=1 Tax=Streptomyces bacillaris TaxID=68179 RepID=UPI00345F1E15
MTHPRRISAAGEIAAKDPRGRIQVVQDPDPSGPPTALRTANPSWSCVGDAATHHIVFQDDVILAQGFFDQVEKVAAAVPGEAVAFYEGWEGRNSGVVRLGALTGASWAYAVDEHVPSLALMLPAEAARGYARFAAEHGDGWPYDVVIQRYLKALGIPVRIAVPSTVDHDDVPSLAGNSKHGWRRATYFTDAAAEVVSPDCASFPVVPFYQYGESKCAVRQDGRWEYLDTDRYLRRIGLAERCDADFAGAGEPDLPAEVRRQVWLTAFATGVAVAGATGREPDPETAAAVMDSLGPGGLCEEYTDAELLPMIPRIRELALAALASGRTAHGTGPRPTADTTTVVVTGGAPALGAELARLLTDAGRPAAYTERLGDGRGQEVHTVVHLGDRSGSAYAVQDLLADAEKAGARRLVHIGSAEVYRGAAADECAEDTVAEPPQDPVARAWWNDEQACLRWGGETGVPVQLVRLAEQPVRPGARGAGHLDAPGVDPPLHDPGGGPGAPARRSPRHGGGDRRRPRRSRAVHRLQRGLRPLRRGAAGRTRRGDGPADDMGADLGRGHGAHAPHGHRTDHGRDRLARVRPVAERCPRPGAVAGLRHPRRTRRSTATGHRWLRNRPFDRRATPSRGSSPGSTHRPP